MKPSPCPPQIPTPRFSSPNSPLPPEELEQLKACLERVNDLLRTLGNPPDPWNKEALRLHLRRLRGERRGKRVVVEVACAQGPGCGEADSGGCESYAGRVRDAGKDYLELALGEREESGERDEGEHGPVREQHAGRHDEQHVLIPYSRTCTVTAKRYDDDEESAPALPLGPIDISPDINPDLRRDLVLNFGKTVAGNPDLISTFFGLPLHLRLRQVVGSQTIVRLDRETVAGKLFDLDENSIKVRTALGVERQINLADVCAILI
ncbi:MAG: hypothetical protein ACM3VX_01220 [Bacteroidota bacterium]